MKWFNDNESVRAKTLDLMQYHGVPSDWRFEYSNGKKALACVKARKTPYGIINKRIMISKYYIANCKDGSIMLDTILHEIAHCLDIETRGFSHHDNVWKRLAQSIGSKGERCKSDWSIAETSYKYTAMCPTCGVVGHRHRKSEGVYKCREHKQPITWIKNY